MGRSMVTATGSVRSGSLYCSTLPRPCARTGRSRRLDVPGLFVAQQVAGAAQFEILHGDVEAASERVFCAMVARRSCDCWVIGLDGSYRK